MGHHDTSILLWAERSALDPFDGTSSCKPPDFSGNYRFGPLESEVSLEKNTCKFWPTSPGMISGAGPGRCMQHRVGRSFPLHCCQGELQGLIKPVAKPSRFAGMDDVMTYSWLGWKCKTLKWRIWIILYTKTIIYLTNNSFSQTWPGKQNLHDTLDTVIRDTYSSPILMFFENDQNISKLQSFSAAGGMAWCCCRSHRFFNLAEMVQVAQGKLGHQMPRFEKLSQTYSSSGTKSWNPSVLVSISNFGGCKL